MAKKIYLSPSSQKENKYATGNTNEMEQCREISKACANYLIKKGFEVKNGDYGDMYDRVAESNRWGADLHIPIHTNAFDGTITGGTQIYMCKLSGEHKKVGQAVFNRLAPITVGTSHEKLVKNTSFYEINSAKAICVYIECEFHDTKAGADCIRNNTKQIGEAIAKGICDYYGVKDEVKPVAPVVTAPAYVVKKGDNLWSIAQKQLGNGGRYPEIKALNNLTSDVLKVGQILKMPTTKKTQSIKVGSTVKVNKGAKTYDGKTLASFVYGRKHKVKEIKGNRAVITYLGITVCAIDVKNLTLA
jgi:N-acetylmuramoyl-L-alanine amidase